MLVDLLSRTANGDKSAFRALYAEAGPKLFAICLRMMKNRDEAEDVFQEAFVKIWERSHQYDAAKGQALGWLATIARNCALDRLRKPGRRVLPFDEAVVEEIDAHVQGIDQTAEGRDLKRCLEALREDYRRVVVLAYVNGMTHEELAGQLDRPMGTIKSWVRRGLEQLKGCLEA
jgi:RNA polymerase sigma-70 factor (ECF subfamily)